MCNVHYLLGDESFCSLALPIEGITCKSQHHYDIVSELIKVFSPFDVYDDVTNQCKMTFCPPNSKIYRITSRLDKSKQLVCIMESK